MTCPARVQGVLIEKERAVESREFTWSVEVPGFILPFIPM